MLNFFRSRKASAAPTGPVAPAGPEPVAAGAQGDPEAVKRQLERSLGLPGQMTITSPESGVAPDTVGLQLARVEDDRLVFTSAEPWPEIAAGAVLTVELAAEIGVLHFRLGEAPSAAGEQEYVAPLPTQVQRDERRQFVRVHLSTCAVLEIRGGSNIESTVGDLSAGGISVYCPVEIKAAQTVRISFSPEPGVDFNGLWGQVVRVRHFPGSLLWAAAIRFVDLTPMQENSLVQLIYRIQVQSGRGQRHG